MIPVSKPAYALEDLRAAIFHDSRAIHAFERELAAYFDFQDAIVFPYGRSALYAALKALSSEDGEVVQPAYNCAVVAHATVAAGYRPVFVDATDALPNQDEDRMLDAVGKEAVAVIPTSIYGMTFPADRLCEEIRHRNRNARILVDCCQAFDAKWQGRLLMHSGDGALLAFGIGKPMTTLYGGALLTNHLEWAKAVRAFRDHHYKKPSAIRAFQRMFYFLASWAALSPAMTSLTDFLINTDTPFSRYLWNLRAREAIRLPEDNEVLMLPLEAAIGREQLRRAEDFMKRRLEIASAYGRAFARLSHIEVLPWLEGSTYTIYSIRLKQPDDRFRIMSLMRKQGIQCDTILSYVIPGLDCYREIGFSPDPFPCAHAWASTVINLPSHPSMKDHHVHAVIRAMETTFGDAYG